MTLTKEQREERRQFIGASDVPIILGLSPYKGKDPKHLYAEKYQGLELPEDEDESEEQEWGHLLEAAILKRYAEKLQVQYPGAALNAPCPRRIHPTLPWAACTPDGEVYHDAESWGVDGKNVGAYNGEGWGPDGSSIVPVHIEAQMRWSMFVTGRSRWDVARLLGGNRFRMYTILRDETWEVEALKTVNAFRAGYFVDGSPIPEWRPAPVLVNDVVRPVEETGIELILARDEAQRMLEEAEEHFSRCDRELKKFIGTDKGIQGGEWRALYLPCKGKTTTDWKAVAERLKGQVEIRQFLQAIHENTKVGQPYRRLTVSHTKETA
jgi:putative phage-type endonuclease